MASRQLSSNMTNLLRIPSLRQASRGISTIHARNPLTTTNPTQQQPNVLTPQYYQYQSRRALHSPYKDSQERDSLKPRKAEGTATGSDDEVAKMDEAWDTSKTRPEEELEESRGKDGGWSMLDESGGNQEFSKPQGDNPSENRGGEKSGKKMKSGETKTKKHGQLKSPNK
ncbi:hypothetical protein QBC37DRAFT_408950 [Rhypophila decipiens]|uniref:Uncharacterized protein n=1 Tax=Rhypophila decipiens TaxID=261697 RepID=A0AAN7BBQ3_9PEZI|nr:hypothetical protein QBC37DRAFT_408950 [Rhypophila decipiens]